MSSSIKSLARNIAACFYYASGAYRSAHVGKILILMYHRVLQEHEIEDSFTQCGMYVAADAFEKQMAFVRENYTVLQFETLLSLWQSNGIDPGRKYCVITFDDGWVDNYRNAYPILLKHHMPATIFLPVSFVGSNRWFWPELLKYLLNHHFQELPQLQAACEDNIIIQAAADINGLTGGTLTDDHIEKIIQRTKSSSGETVISALYEVYNSLGVDIPSTRVIVGWDEVQEMAQNGISFGSHGCDHQILTHLSRAEIARELEESRNNLIARNVNYLNVLCYPNGSHNAEIKKLARETGYDAAVTTAFGFEGRRPADLFALHRVGVHNDISSTIPLYSFHLSGIKQRWS